MARLVIVLWLALATPAFATPLFHTSLDSGAIDTSADLHFWSAIQGSPAISSTVDGTSGNQRSLEISAASGAAEYAARTVTSASTLVASMRLYVPTATSIPSARRKVLSFYDTGASQTGCMATIEADDSDPALYRLRVLYESADNTGGECAASATQDGKECTTEADCDEVNPGEASCAPGVFAATLALAKGTWYVVSLEQQNGTGEVTCSLWQGTAGASPASYQRGSQTRDQGICVGGSVADNPCDDDTDCTGGGTCDVADVVTIEQVRYGTDDTETGALTYLIDDLVIDSADAHPNYWIQTVLPSGTGTESDWTGSNTDVDDGPTLDGNTTRLSKANETSCSASVCLHDVATTNPATDTILAVGLVGWMQDTETGSGRTMNVRLSAHDGTNTTNGTNLDQDGLSDEGSSAGYHQLAPSIFPLAPDGSAWSATDANNLQIRVDRNSSTHTTNEVRVTAVQAEVLFDLADPAVPTIIPDRNQDGEDTVCLVFDSTGNDAGFHDLVVAGLTEATNVLDCARGGAEAGDVTDTISVAGNNNDILDGGATQFLSCRALKGTLQPCDVVVLEIGVNTLRTGVLANPANDTTEHGLRYPGVCDSQGGANDQGRCFCPKGTDSRRSSVTESRYCRTKGSDWLTACSGHADCGCSVDADCCADCPDGACATCTNATGTCSGGICTCTGFGCIGCALSTAASNWHSACVPGCLDSPQCPSGLCIATESGADLMSEIVTIEAQRAARPTPNPAATPSGASGKPIIIYAAPPPGQSKNLLNCWQDIEREVGNYRTGLLGWSQAQGLPWLDMYGAFLAGCPGGHIGDTACRTDGCSWNGTSCLYDRGCCLRDEIHWNTLGQAIAADAIIACLTNAGGTSHALWDCNLLGAP